MRWKREERKDGRREVDSERGREEGRAKLSVQS